MSRDRRPSGGRFGANLPYLAIGAASLVLLVGYIVLAHPFTPSTPTVTSTSGTSTIAGTTTSSLAGETTIPSAAALAGEEIFNGTCIACHGSGGVGVEGLGKPLPTSAFVAGLTDEELLAFLIVGRPVDDPLNTTGIAMPARGGNTSLTDADLEAVVAYLRSIATAG